MQRVKAFEEFLCPFGCMISGPSMSGKSFFILELLRRNKEYFLPPPDRIVYAYGSWQEAFSMVPNVEFVDGVESLKAITFDSKKNNLLVLDDLMEELSSDKNASPCLQETCITKTSLFFSSFKIYSNKARVCETSHSIVKC